MTARAGLQTALAAEHAAVYVFGVLGAQTSRSAQPILFDQLSAAYVAHRAERDRLVRAVRDLGGEPVAAEPAYQVPERLAAAWGAERPRKRVLAYQAAGRLMRDFREHCLAHSLVDHSLLVELFSRLLDDASFRESFFQSRTHLIAEHLEEDAPFTHRDFRRTPEMFPGADEHADR